MPITKRKPPSIQYFRSAPAMGAPQQVDRVKRVIHGYAVITRGEALGHDYWVDSEMLDQVVEFGNAKKTGLKTRFTHPGLCSDGLGKYLGRAKNFAVDGDIVRADLHLSKSASKTPSGDLAGYVMDLAIEDPESFGTSIVFSHDSDAELQFVELHSDDDGFSTPDELNARNLPHTRLKALKASDVVDEPAANPGGFFSDQDEILSRAEEGLSYVFGLSEAKPSALSLGIDADRAKQFVERFCERHGLRIKQLTEVEKMTPEEFVKANPAAVQAWRDEGSNQAQALFQERITSFQSAFTGRESFALSKLAEGRELIQARAEFSDVLLSELAEAKKAAPVIQHQVVRQTGIQFNAGERELITDHVEDFSHLAPKERAVEEWKSQPEIRSEFDSPASYAAWMKFAPRINGGE